MVAKEKAVLDTLVPLQSAIHLYRKFGFLECEPYYNNPRKFFLPKSQRNQEKY